MTPPSNFKFSHIADGQEVWVPEDDPKSATVWMRPVDACSDSREAYYRHWPRKITFIADDRVKEDTARAIEAFPGFKFHKFESKESAAPTSGEGERG